MKDGDTHDGLCSGTRALRRASEATADMPFLKRNNELEELIHGRSMHVGAD